MSVVEQTASTSKSPRRIPSTVRLGPQVVNDLCAHLGDEKTRADEGQSAAGLLFGTTGRDVLSVEAFKAFSATGLTGNGAPKRECLDAAFERFVATAKTDPDLTLLHLVGWYCIRGPGDIAPLFDSDIEFHNRRFRRATDVALILNPKQHTGASIELYSRSTLKAAISKKDYRSGSLRLDSGACVNTTSDVTMRETIDDDYYLRVFQVLDSLDEAARRKSWKRIALRLKIIIPSSLRPTWMKTGIAAGVHTTSPDISSLRAKTATRRIRFLGRSTSPEANSSLTGTRSARTKPRWILSAGLLLLATGVAWLYARPLLSSLPGRALLLRAPASTPLDMRVEPQVGGSLLVRWDPHSVAVQSAKNGTVQIDDGFEHRNLRLDSNQVANGSILYTPTSRDLTFRLEVLGGNGAPISESLRVVNGSKSALAAHTIQNERPSTFPVTTPIPSPPVKSLITPAATSSIAPAPTKPSRSGITASNVMRPPTRKIPGPGPEIQKMRNPVAVGPAELPARERLSKKTDSGPGKSELRKTAQVLSPTQPPVNSPQPAVMNNSTSTRYLPPRPLKEVIPSANNLASSVSPGATDVEVEVRINDEGRVTEARIVNKRSNNNELLTSAALGAAKEWIFEPAKAHGKSVFSDHIIKFHFAPQTGQQ